MTQNLDGGAGTIQIRCNRQARKLKLWLSLNGTVCVTRPPEVSRRRAMVFAMENHIWIEAQRQKLDKLQSMHDSLPRSEMRFSTIAEACSYLHHRLKQLAATYGFLYKRISIRRQRTRWGSCSRDNCISLNLRLASLPQKLCDYVMLHELVHTRIRNHGPKFWEMLHGLVPEGNELASQLRFYRIEWLEFPGDTL